MKREMRKFRKAMVFGMVAAMAIGVSACGGDKKGGESDTVETNTVAIEQADVDHTSEPIETGENVAVIIDDSTLTETDIVDENGQPIEVGEAVDEDGQPIEVGETVEAETKASTVTETAPTEENAIAAGETTVVDVTSDEGWE